MFSCNPMEYSIKYCFLCKQKCIFTTTLAYAYQCPFGSKHFCTCSRRKDLQKHVCEPFACSTARIYHHASETTNLMVKMLLEIFACKSRQLHWGFGTKNVSFRSTEVQRPISCWRDPVSQDSLSSASGTADNHNRISKKVGPAAISSDLSPTGS